MALTNYMTGAEATSVTQAGGSFLQLGVDGSYSFLMWGLAFVQANFVLILIGVAIALLVNYGRKKLSSAKGANVIR